jgi:hypothetical protein
MFEPDSKQFQKYPKLSSRYFCVFAIRNEFYSHRRARARVDLLAMEEAAPRSVPPDIARHMFRRSRVRDHEPPAYRKAQPASGG